MALNTATTESCVELWKERIASYLLQTNKAHSCWIYHLTWRRLQQARTFGMRPSRVLPSLEPLLAQRNVHPLNNIVNDETKSEGQTLSWKCWHERNCKLLVVFFVRLERTCVYCN